MISQSRPESSEYAAALSRNRLGRPTPRNIAILRALQLGDMLCAVPALRALRALAPDARLTLISLPWARDFARRFSKYIDAFVEFPEFPGLPDQRVDGARVLQWLAAARKEHFDFVVQLHGSGYFVNELVALIHNGRSAGFFRPGDLVPDQERFIEWSDEGSELTRLLRLAQHLGAHHLSDALEFPIADWEIREWELVAAKHNVQDGQCICVHAGTRVPSRRWAAERFAAVADVVAELGFQIVLAGTLDESSVAATVHSHMRHRAIDLSGQLSLGAVAALMRSARLVLYNDPAAALVASAIGTATVECSGEMAVKDVLSATAALLAGAPSRDGESATSP